MRKLVIFAILLSFVAPASARDLGHRSKARASWNLPMQQFKKIFEQSPFMNLGEANGMPMMEDLSRGITEQLSQVQERLQDMMR